MSRTRGLRILFHHRVAAADGMRVHIAELVEALRAEGHEVLVVGPGAAAEGPAGVSTRLERVADLLRSRVPAGAFEALELLYNVPAYWRLRAAAKAFRPDVLYERYNLFLLAGLLLKTQLRLPLLLEINSPLAEERRTHGNLQFKGLGRRCEAALWRGADAALPVTQVLAETVRAVRGDGPIAVIPNGANINRRSATGSATRLSLGLDKDSVVLGFVGFVRAWHGVGWAVEALAELPERAHLVVVGDGPGTAALSERAEALGVDHRLHLVGRVPHEEVAAYMQAFDVALQTAAVSYASPLKLFEYMALERAVIAPDQPNIREVLAHGRDALLFPAGDRAGFIAALHRLCEDPELRLHLGRNAGRTVREHPFTWRHNAKRIAEFARALISGSTVPAGDAAGSATRREASCPSRLGGRRDRARATGASAGPPGACPGRAP